MRTASGWLALTAVVAFACAGSGDDDSEAAGSRDSGGATDNGRFDGSDDTSGRDVSIEGIIELKSPVCEEIIADPSAPLREHGTLDRISSSAYPGYLRVRNEEPTKNKPIRIDVEAVCEFIGMAFELSLVWEEEEPLQISSEGLYVVLIPLLTSQCPARLQSHLIEEGPEAIIPTVSNISIIYEKSDGTEVRTNVFSFPIGVCYGCLVFYPDEAISVAPDGSKVCEPDNSDIEPFPCALGMDEPIDCRLCLGNEICRNPS